MIKVRFFIIISERKDTTMIKKIPLSLTIIGFIGCLACVPLVVTSCTNERNNGKVYENVEYTFNFTRHEYVVSTYDNKTFYVPPKNFYKIDTYGYVSNEYFVATNELFVYRT